MSLLKEQKILSLNQRWIVKLYNQLLVPRTVMTVFIIKCYEMLSHILPIKSFFVLLHTGRISVTWHQTEETAVISERALKRILDLENIQVWRGSSPCTTLLGKMTVQNPSRNTPKD